MSAAILLIAKPVVSILAWLVLPVRLGCAAVLRRALWLRRLNLVR